MIISLGYRIKSSIATRFRRWATERIKEYMIKGFTMDDERLKGNGGGNYWKELLDRIKDIRSSWSIRFENIETIIKGEVQYPRLKFVLIIETIRLLIRHTGYIKEKHEEIPKQRGSIGHISGK